MTETVAAGQLRAIIERIERVEDEIKDLNADKSEIYKEARGVGFDVKAIRQCVAARKLDSAEREERDAIFDLYWSALGDAPHVHVHEEHKSDSPKSRPDDAAASFTQQSNSPRQERPSAEERSSDRSGGQFGDAPKPATIPDSSAPTSSPEQTDTPEAAAPASGTIQPDRAIPGEDGPPSEPNPEDTRAKNDGDQTVIGQRHVRGNSGQAAPVSNEDVPAFLLKDRQPSPAPNPDCQNPKTCRWSHSMASCARCATDAAIARQRGRAA